MLITVNSQAVFVPFGKHLLYAQRIGVINVFFDKFSDLCQRSGISKSKAAESVGLNRTSVIKWKNGAIPSGATIAKLADFFGVSTDYLLDGGGNPQKTQKAPTLNQKDERDIKKKMDEMLELFDSADALMFDGEPLDEETRQLLRESYENQLRITKQLAKSKFTPKNIEKSR